MSRNSIETLESSENVREKVALNCSSMELEGASTLELASIGTFHEPERFTMETFLFLFNAETRAKKVGSLYSNLRLGSFHRL